MATYADAVVSALKDVGVRRLFGMPGGGSNADIIEAAGRADLPFSLAQTETASAFMASAQAEITGRPSACLATLGPGAASLTNGIANAHLDRVPLIVLTDCRTAASAAVMEHQTLAHSEIYGSMVKYSGRPTPIDGQRVIRDAMDAVTGPPPGPVHLDLAVELTSAATESYTPPPGAARPASSAADLSSDARTLLGAARRPVLLVGLGARNDAIAAKLRALATRARLPALVTYKAKGVIPDAHPWWAGVLTNGALERDVLDQADLFLAVGLDPVELLPRPWSFQQPIIALNSWAISQRQLPIHSDVVGDVSRILDGVAAEMGTRSEWDCADVRRIAETQRARMRPSGDPAALLPHRVVELVGEVYPDARITVDAGAHMFPVMALWQASAPCGVLISNGLATMGFALPSAIGAALIDRDRPVIAFTGDGGILMCVAELLTAARERLNVRIIVFDDGALSLIKIKQLQRGYAVRGVDMTGTDWSALGAAFGITVYEAENEQALADALQLTAGHQGPVLIAARVDASAYEPTIRALRG